VSDHEDQTELDRALARIVELEVRYSHQEAALNELSDVLYRQQQLIDVANRRLRALERKLSGVDEGVAPRDPKDEVPPHY